MSATDYGVCPNCIRRFKERLDIKKGELGVAYGVLPLAEFDALRTKVQEMEEKLAHWDRSENYTMREDYNGVGVDEDGEFSIHYIADCSKCAFHYKYEFVEQALTEDLITKYRRTEVDEEII